MWRSSRQERLSPAAAAAALAPAVFQQRLFSGSDLINKSQRPRGCLCITEQSAEATSIEKASARTEGRLLGLPTAANIIIGTVDRRGTMLHMISGKICSGLCAFHLRRLLLRQRRPAAAPEPLAARFTRWISQWAYGKSYSAMDQGNSEAMHHVAGLQPCERRADVG